MSVHTRMPLYYLRYICSLKIIAINYARFSSQNQETVFRDKEAANIGLVRRKSGNKLSKSVVYDLLNNPIYYGDFYWKEILYNGTHKPVITRELFDKVQKALDTRSSCPAGRQKHDFLFCGMLTCGHCGCAVVAEIHKGKYIYYRCTHNQGKWPDKYDIEAKIDEQFTQSLSQIKIDADVLD